MSTGTAGTKSTNEKEASVSKKDDAISELASQIEGLHVKDGDKDNDKKQSEKEESPCTKESNDGTGENRSSENTKDEFLPSEALQKLATWIGESDRILVVCGAGVSVAAGIPDFRTPGTGLYDNLQAYNLPYPEAVFDVGFYRSNPRPFVRLAGEIWPSTPNNINDNNNIYKSTTIRPTLTHVFFRLLSQHNKLLRIYTQNIDGLEFAAGVPDEQLVECHGHFRTAACIDCHRAATDMVKVRDTILVDKTVPLCEYCGGYVKPDIVFFGEALPALFHQRLRHDRTAADLCLVLGTSLMVAPVSLIPEMVHCSRRALLNRELVGDFIVNNNIHDKTVRDLFQPGDCDDSVRQLARLLGWEEELELEYNKIHSSSSNNDKSGETYAE